MFDLQAAPPNGAEHCAAIPGESRVKLTSVHLFTGWWSASGAADHQPSSLSRSYRISSCTAVFSHLSKLYCAAVDSLIEWESGKAAEEI